MPSCATARFHCPCTTKQPTSRDNATEKSHGFLHENWLYFAGRIAAKTETTRNTDVEYPHILFKKTGTGLEYDYLHAITGDDTLLDHLQDALHYEFTFKFCYNTAIQMPALARSAGPDAAVASPPSPTLTSTPCLPR